MAPITPKIDYQSLVTLGLSEHEAKIYVTLLGYSSARASQLAKILRLLVPSVHRSLRSLMDKGFVLKLDTSPALFQAIAPQIAVSKFASNTAGNIFADRDHALHALSFLQPKANTVVQLITGANQWYDLYCERTNYAQQEVLVISVGEQVDTKVREAFAAAAKRGVKHRFIFHRYTKDNEAILKGWFNTGDTEVRHFSDAGYHLVIWDTKELAMVASNPENPSERSGMLLKSPQLAASLRTYFFTLWDQALPITSTSFLQS